MAPLRTRLAAEALGTGFLLSAVVGSGIMAQRLFPDSVGLALLANTLATGAALVALISTFAATSGAHFNPAVTLAFALRGELARADALAYVVAQIAGGFVGVWLAHAMFDEALLSVSTHERAGLGLALSEVVATFGLVLVILRVARERPEAVPVCVGAYITAAYWFTASTSFANPAVTLARAATDSFAGIRPADVGVFIAAQLVGALLATGTARLLEAAPPTAAESP